MEVFENISAYYLMILIYFLAINFISFGTVGYDKDCSVKNRWRISEKTFIFFSAAGGGIGTLLGFYSFRHKTKKPILLFLCWFFTIISIIAIVLIIIL